MRLPSASIHFRSIHCVVPHVLLALAILAAGQSGTAQTQAISLGSSSNAFGSAGVLFPTTPVGSTSAPVTISLQVNTAGTTITQIAALSSQGGKQEYSVTSTGCALNAALAAGAVCNVVVTFSPIYPGERTVPLQVRTSAGPFNFGLVGSGIGPEVALTPSIITTFAGNGTTGYSGDSQVATNAQIAEPVGEAFDSEGNLYFADSANNVIRKVSVNTGVITTVAGNGGAGFSGDHGPATDAQLNAPDGIALDGAGNIYIADSTNCFIRKVAAATGIITTVVGTGFSPSSTALPLFPQATKGMEA